MEGGPGRPGTGLDAYAARLREVQEVVLSKERPNLMGAARLLAGSLNCDEPDRMIHVFGCGHSHLMAEEAFWRAGGLVPVHPILDPNLTLLAACEPRRWSAWRAMPASSLPARTCVPVRSWSCSRTPESTPSR